MAITAAALLPDRLVIDPTTFLNDSCGGIQFAPLTIEAVRASR
jgi:hypothetical protein